MRLTDEQWDLLAAMRTACTHYEDAWCVMFMMEDHEVLAKWKSVEEITAWAIEFQTRELTPAEQAFAKQVKDLCLKNYSNGGDVIIECYTDRRIVGEFKTLEEVKEFCQLHYEQEQDCAFGDEDPVPFQWSE